MYRLPRALTLRYASSPIRRPAQIPRIQRIARRQQRWQSQMIYRANGEAMRMQSVRFKKPGIFSTRRLLTFALYTGVVYGYVALLWRQMDVEIEFVEDEETEEEQQQQQQQDSDSEALPDSLTGPLYADEDSTFIPLTWSTPLPRTFYRGSDPEWQEFIRIAKDPARHKRIQDELVQLVYTGCVQHPTISRQLGSNTQVGKYWLDISFPDGPPQEYERRGIEIGEGFIAWSAQKVDAEKQWRVERALVPKAAAEGVWKTGKVLAGIQWRRMKQRLGWEAPDPRSPEERFRLAVEMQQQSEQAQQQQKSGGQQSQGDSNPALNSATPSSPAAPAQPSRTPARSEGLPWHIPTVPLPSSPFAPSTSNATSNPSSSPTDPPSNLATDLPIAIHVFSATLSKSWNPNPKKLEPPRGAFVVQGLVEVRGSKGRILFDVLSAYDPKGALGVKGEGGPGKFVNVNAAVRGYKRWRQSPKGGP